MSLTIRSSRDRFAARLARYRVPPRRSATRSGLTQVLGAMAVNLASLEDYQCSEYLASQWAAEGLWDELAQLFLLEPLSRVEILSDIGFMQVGRPGVDGIGLGYRFKQAGLWAYYPVDQRFELLATSLELFLKGWSTNTITV